MERKKRENISRDKFNLVAKLLEDEKKTIAEISSLAGLHRHTVSNISKKIQLGIKFCTAGEKCSETIRRKRAVPNQTVQLLSNLVAVENEVTQKELQEHVFSQQGNQISISSVCRKLKAANITRKRLSLVPEERNSPVLLNTRAIYAVEFESIRHENAVFLDESGFNLHLRRGYGYSLKNTKAFITAKANRGQNQSLMCAISYSGIVAFEVKPGAYNRESFKEFIQRKLIPYFNENPEKVLIMDNCRFHHSQDVLLALSSANIRYKFLPAYSPQLNPIEEFFSMIKSRYVSRRKEFNSISECLGMILSESTFSEQCVNFYLNMLRWIEKARARNEFI